MKVAIVSRNSLIPVRAYGGTQRDIWAEGKELNALGHRVVFVVRAGSECPFADVLPYDARRPLDDQIPKDVDVVHYHGNLREPLSKPNLTTVHGNGQPGETFDINSVFVSGDHARRHGSERFVYNGLDFDELGDASLRARRDGLLFLAKASWRLKNLKGSRTIAAMAGKRLHVAGGRGVSLSGKVRYHGMVGGDRKAAIIRGREALLFPVLWDEPLGLAVLESLYFGLPVLGTPFGSLPELVGPERGVLSTSVSELAAAARRTGDFDRVRCHEFVVDTFGARTMTLNYIELFEKVMSGQTLNPERPRTLPESTGKTFAMTP